MTGDEDIHFSNFIKYNEINIIMIGKVEELEICSQQQLNWLKLKLKLNKNNFVVEFTTLF